MERSASISGDHLPTAIGMIINEYTKAFLRRSRGCIRVTSFISDLYFDKLIDYKLSELEELEIDQKRKVHEEEGFVLWNYSISRKMRTDRIHGSFLVLQIGHFIFLITGYPPSFVKKGITHIARKMYPDMMIAYITAEEIHQILQTFARTKGTELFYSKYVAKKVFGEPDTDLRYKRGLYIEAFKKARETRPRLWIDSIRVFSKDEPQVDFSLSRDGYLTYYKGNFEEYYEHVLIPIEEYCGQRLRIFEKRGRRETAQKELRPLLIQYDSKVFEDASVRKQLVNVIAKYDFCNYSVIHSGNPHVYLNIVDRIDNSSFSLRTYRSDSLVIGPQVKATKASLMRFSKHLMDSFLEGRISDIKT